MTLLEKIQAWQEVILTTCWKYVGAAPLLRAACHTDCWSGRFTCRHITVIVVRHFKAVLVLPVTSLAIESL